MKSNSPTTKRRERIKRLWNRGLSYRPSVERTLTLLMAILSSDIVEGKVLVRQDSPHPWLLYGIKISLGISMGPILTITL